LLIQHTLVKRRPRVNCRNKVVYVLHVIVKGGIGRVLTVPTPIMKNKIIATMLGTLSIIRDRLVLEITTSNGDADLEPVMSSPTAETPVC
jgi:hypothetical protein